MTESEAVCIAEGKFTVMSGLPHFYFEKIFECVNYLLFIFHITHNGFADAYDKLALWSSAQEGIKSSFAKYLSG